MPRAAVLPLKLGMKLFIVGQHRDELSDLPGASFRFLDVLDSEKDGVSVLAIERGKECLSLFVRIEGHLQVIGDSRLTRRCVRAIPATILPGSFDLTHASGVHSPCRNQRLGFRLVDLGPDASGSPGRESLEPKVFALCLLLTIDPAVAKCDFERFGI